MVERHAGMLDLEACLAMRRSAARRHGDASRPARMRLGRRLLAALLACMLITAAAADDDDLDDLFNLDAPLQAGADAGAETGSGLRLGGYGEFAGAYTYAQPEHWSKLRARFELAATGRLGSGIRFKASARADGDAAYGLESGHYPAAVRRDQRRDFSVRETYLDFAAGDWEFRLGRQHIVWGEMVGLFLADVVSARDTREFFLPEFETMRIPQWAVRAEYFAGQSHFELLWVPVPSHDEVGRPGADFFPFPFLTADADVREVRPSRRLSNTHWGARISHLIDGWDLTAFYYRSRDVAPTLYTLPGPSGPVFELRNDRIHQIGATFSKDFGAFVLKGEGVHTRGRRFITADPAPFGLKDTSMLDYVVGIDIPIENVWRVNLQYYGRQAFSHTPGFGFDRNESGATLLVNRRIGNDLEAEVLYATSLNREDYMLRPKLVWNITPAWRGQFGADIFGGRSQGLFGRFDARDRVYMELRRWF